MSRLVWYDFQTCLNLFRINMIQIDTILKYVKTWWNSLKLSKWHKESSWRQSYSLDCFEQVKRSKTDPMGTMLCDLEVEIFKTTPPRSNFFRTQSRTQSENRSYSVQECVFCFSKMGPISFRSLIFIFDHKVALGITLNIFQILLILMPKYLQESWKNQ